MDIQATHRIGKKEVIIVNVVNRVRAALINRKNLVDDKRYGEETRQFLNDPFISEFVFFNFVNRRAVKDKSLFR